MTHRRTWLSFVLILVPAYVVLTVLALAVGQDCAQPLLPLFHWELAWLAPDFQFDPLTLSDDHGQTVVGLQAFIVQSFWIGQKSVPTGGPLVASTLLGHVLQPALILIPVVLAWPLNGLGQRAVALMLAVPVLIGLAMLDVPIVLLGSIEDLIYATVNPSYADQASFIGWMNFMNGGGRPGLALAATLGILACSRKLSTVTAIHANSQPTNGL